MEDQADFSEECQNDILPEVTKKLQHLTFYSTEEATEQQPSEIGACAGVISVLTASYVPPQPHTGESSRTCNVYCSPILRNLIEDFRLQNEKSRKLFERQLAKVLENSDVGICPLTESGNVGHGTYKARNAWENHHKMYAEVKSNVRHSTFSRNSASKRLLPGELHECDVCHRTFPRMRALVKHRRIHDREKPRKCYVCHSTFLRSCAFGVHLHPDTGKLFYECTMCHRTFPRRHALETHICLRARKNSYELLKASLKENVCPHTGERVRRCRTCIRLGLEDEPKGPVEVHECNVCLKRFLNPNALKAHRATHAGENPYVCDVCHKKFLSYGNLNDHCAAHAGENPYVCDVCHEEFSSYGILNDHRAAHASENPYVCDVCHEVFPSYGILNDHRAAHARWV